MEKLTRVAIMDDHQSIIDGYLHRLSQNPSIVIVDYTCCGQELHQMVERQPIDVLILDISVPVRPEGKESYPVLSQIPLILDQHPQVHILVISMYHQPTLIEAVIDSGASGYILKEDVTAIQSLAEIVISITEGAFYLSPGAAEKLARKIPEGDLPSSRQLEALSFYAAHPDLTSKELARRMGIAPSTFRTLLSRAYVHLGVKNGTEAVLKARQLGLITLEDPPADPPERSD